jgi:ribosomal protein S15P/S13E
LRSRSTLEFTIATTETCVELIESKIHRLSKYYKREDKIPKNWKYAAVIAQLE